MVVKCILFISSLIVGFALGRMGSHVYDGLFVLGSQPGDHQVKLALDNEDLPYCHYLTLKVVNEEEIEDE